jgi:hypothetical protein
MASIRASRFLVLQSLMLAGPGCSGESPSGGPPAAATVGGSASGVGAGTGGAPSTSGGNFAHGGSIAGAMGGVTALGGGTGTGGAPASGGQRPTGGTPPSGGSTAAGGTTAASGATAAGGANPAGGRAMGGTSPSGGTTSVGGSSGRGGGRAAGGTSPAGGSTGVGGITSTGGSSGDGGGTATGGTSGQGSCAFTLTTNSTSSKMATVGIVEWSTTLSDLSSAQIVYTLDNAGPDILNRGGTAPVDLTRTSHRTLLLGLKQSSSYTFHIEAESSDGTRCTSPDYAMKTGALSGAPNITRTATNASAQAKGFIVTSTGIEGGGMGTSPGAAYIIDADGAVVWHTVGPAQCSRARMDYEGVNMWMTSLNVFNSGGEMRYVAMDGQTGQNNVSGLSGAHHDFTVLPGGVVVAMVWASSGTDPESNLIERSSSGTLTTKFRIGSNLYVGGPSAIGGSSTSYHCNYVAYHESDDSYTIADRNPSVVVKVTRSGNPVWQIGGSCSGAPAPKCASATWKVNHGQDFDPNGNLLIFNNGPSGASHVFEYKITDSGSFGITTVKDFTSGSTSSAQLGDVQRLPNGNTLITYSNGGVMLEVDSSWATVQTLKGRFGYADWRETLYGPPARI